MQADTLAKQLLFSTIRIEAVSPTKISIGTGFVFAYRNIEDAILRNFIPVTFVVLVQRWTLKYRRFVRQAVCPAAFPVAGGFRYYFPRIRYPTKAG
jgi:hypothetical protein